MCLGNKKRTSDTTVSQTITVSDAHRDSKESPICIIPCGCYRQNSFFMQIVIIFQKERGKFKWHFFQQQ